MTCYLKRHYCHMTQQSRLRQHTQASIDNSVERLQVLCRLLRNVYKRFFNLVMRSWMVMFISVSEGHYPIILILESEDRSDYLLILF